MSCTLPWAGAERWELIVEITRRSAERTGPRVLPEMSIAKVVVQSWNGFADSS